MTITTQSADGTLHQFPDGTSDAVIDGAMKTYATQATPPQPTMLQTLAASPPGRFIHDAVLQPIAGMASLLSKIDPTGGGTQQAVNSTEGAYNAAIAAQRNRPGYAAARAVADKSVGAPGGSGLSDQLISPLTSALSGTAGLFGGGMSLNGALNSSNAAADAQTASQDAYRSRHPVISTAANLAGGLLMGSPAKSAPATQQAISGAVAPTDAATSYVQRLMASSPAASTPAGLQAAQVAAAGKPITAAEAIGRPAEVALGALARRDGSTADALSGQMQTRTAVAPSRILSDYAAASGIDPAAASGDIQSFVDAGQKAAEPLYKQAYDANPNIASPMLDKILATPAGSEALASARTQMQNDMSLMGTPDEDLMSQAKEGGTPIPSNGVASGMKLRVYDYVKRALDDQISAAYSAGNKNKGNIIKDLKGKLVNALDNADVTAIAGPNSTVPAGGLYAQARAQAGEYLSAQKQFELGQQHILDNGVSAADVADHVSGLGPSDQQAYLGGAANRIFGLQQAGKLNAKAFNAPMVQGKLASLMGPQKAQQFLGNMQTEQQMANFARLRTPGAGSPTAEYNAAMQDQDGASGLAMGGLQAAQNVAQHGLISGVTRLAAGKAKDLAASYITRGMAIPVRDAAGKMLMMPPADLAAHLSALPPRLPTPPLQLPQITQSSAFPLGLFGSSGALLQQRNQ